MTIVLVGACRLLPTGIPWRVINYRIFSFRIGCVYEFMSNGALSTRTTLFCLHWIGSCPIIFPLVLLSAWKFIAFILRARCTCWIKLQFIIFVVIWLNRLVIYQCPFWTGIILWDRVISGFTLKQIISEIHRKVIRNGYNFWFEYIK